VVRSATRGSETLDVDRSFGAGFEEYRLSIGEGNGVSQFDTSGSPASGDSPAEYERSPTPVAVVLPCGGLFVTRQPPTNTDEYVAVVQ